MTGQAKNVIHVPKPPPSAFNKERAASQLLLDQMIHSARALAEHLRTLDNRATNTPVTEEQAGDAIPSAARKTRQFTVVFSARLTPATAAQPTVRSAIKPGLMNACLLDE